MAALSQIRKVLAMERGRPAEPNVVVYGMHSAVPKVLGELAKAGRAVVLVADIEAAAAPSDVQLVAGDPTTEA